MIIKDFIKTLMEPKDIHIYVPTGDYGFFICAYVNPYLRKKFYKTEDLNMAENYEIISICNCLKANCISLMAKPIKIEEEEEKE